MISLKKILKYSLILTIPINLFFFVWLTKTLNNYYLFEEITTPILKGKRLHRIGLSVYYDLKSTVFSIVGVRNTINDNLIIKTKNKKQLISNLPQSGSSYKSQSFMIEGENIIMGKVKLRGDNYYHWAFPRKSWRFKTKKENIYNGVNKLNFIIPKGNEMINNFLSYKLAKMLGLLAPNSEIIQFAINGVYKGVRLKVEQIDESFLRNNQRMPNDIYKGDNMGQQLYHGVRTSLFYNASIWEKVSYNNHYAKENKYPLLKLLNEIKESKYSIYELSNFASMAAFIDLTSSFHYTAQHNWRLYYDSYHERMYPIIWDTVGWWKEWIGQNKYNIKNSELMDSLYLNYEFLRLKHHALKLFFLNKEKDFYTLLDNSIKKIKNIVHHDGYSSNMRRQYLNLEQSISIIDRFSDNVKARLSSIKNSVFGNANPKNYKFSILNNKIRLSITGKKLVNQIIIYSNKITNIKNNVFISFKQGDKIIRVDISGGVQINKNKIIINTKLLANANTKITKKGTEEFVYDDATYDLEIGDLNFTHIKAVKLSFDDLEKNEISVQETKTIIQKPFKSILNNIVKEHLAPKKLYWKNNMIFEGFNVIKNDIIIEKGTNIKLAQKATLKFLGKITAIGTKTQPIIFQSLDNTKPWGAIALKDNLANGSVFKHVIFKGGSGDKGKLHEYTGMLSIHNVKDVLIDNSAFYDSKLTDDMVHVIYSKVIFKNTKFIRSLSDALDVDISDVVIDNCEFIDSGNDAIDLMTTNAIVTNTTFERSADKGISIGEGSNLLAFNNLIVSSEIGMQSKDTSLAYIYNSSFLNNKKAIDAYHKNWRYEQGGTIYLDKSIFKGNKINATVGEKSKVIINNSQIDTPENFNAKHLRKKKIIVSHKKIISHDLNHTFFQNYEILVNN